MVEAGAGPSGNQAGCIRSAAGVLNGWWNRVIARLKVIGSLVKARPHVALIPLAVFGLIVGLGCFGVQRAQDRTVRDARAQAYLVAESFAWNLKLGLAVEGFPLGKLESIVLHEPQYTQVQANLASEWPSVWQRVPEGAISLAIAPLGRVSELYPPDAGAMFEVGHDLLDNPLDRALVLRALKNTNYNIDGPVIQLRGTRWGWLNVGIIPLWGRNRTETETWGIPWGPSWQLPPELSYDAANGLKLWGFALISIDTSKFAVLVNAVGRLAAGGYSIQGMRPGVALAGEPAEVPVMPFGPYPTHAVGAPIAYPDEIWTTYVWKTGSSSWHADWLDNMYPVVVVSAFVISVLLFAVLLSWEEHKTLLHSLLPKQAIQRMRAEANYSTLDQQQEKVTSVSLETPASNMLQIIFCLLQSQQPSLQQLLVVKDALQHSADVYKPGLDQLKGRMKESEFVDAEVRQALVNQLVGNDLHSFLTEARTTFGADTAPVSRMQSQAGGKALLDSSRATPVLANQDSPASQLIAAADGPWEEVDWHSQDTQGVLLNLVKNRRASTCSVLSQALASTPTSAAQHQPIALAGTSNVPAVPQSLVPGAQHMLLQAPASPAPTCPAQQTLAQGPQGGVVVQCATEQPSTPRTLLLQLDLVLATSSEWQFDVFALDAASEGRPLSVLAYWLLHTSGLKSWAHMDTAKTVRFLQQVEESYPPNPYHNRRHAAAVLQALHVIMLRGGLCPGYADHLIQLGCYLAAIVHDVGHRGVNNDYLVNLHDTLAIQYNDRSPMENFHAAAAFRLLSQPELNCLSGLTKAQWGKLRKLVIDLVLATDMKQHFATLGQFDALNKTEGVQVASRQPSFGADMRSPQDVEGGSCAGQPMIRPLQPTSDSDRMLSLQVALKCADVGHLAAPLNLHLQWVTSLEEELFLQGDAEKAAGLPLSPLCDRNKEGVTKSQVGFFDFVALPLFKSFTGKFSGCKPLLQHLLDNYHFWQAAATRGSHGPSEAAANLDTKPSLSVRDNAGEQLPAAPIPPPPTMTTAKESA